MGMNYKNLKGLEGKDNQGGLKKIIYYAPTSYFQTIKGFKANPSVEGCLEVDGPHVFLPGKGFHELYTTMDTAKLMMEPTGERDGRGYAPKITEAFHPGLKREASAFARQCKNDEFIVLALTPNGEVVQLGQPDLAAEIFAKQDSGTLSSGRNGYTFEVNSFANGIIYYDSPIEKFPVPAA